jgi:hypothetical protein
MNSRCAVSAEQRAPDLESFKAELVLCRLTALSGHNDIPLVAERIKAAAKSVAFIVAGPSRQAVDGRDPDAACDVETLTFEFLHNARVKCLDLARRHSDFAAAVDAIHAFVFDGSTAQADVPPLRTKTMRDLGQLKLLGTYALRCAEGSVGGAALGVDFAEIGFAPIGHRVGIDVDLDDLDATLSELVEFRLGESNERLVGVLDTGPAEFAKAGVILLTRPDNGGSGNRHGLFLSVVDRTSTVAGRGAAASCSPEGRGE